VFNYTTAPGFNDGYLLVTNAADRMKFIEGESATAGGWTVQAASSARGGNVIQALPTSANVPITNYYNTISGVSANARLFAVFASISFSATGGAWTVTTHLFSHGQSVDVVSAPVADTVYPHIVFLGMFALPGALDRMAIDVAVASVAGSPVLNIDYFCLLAMDDDYSRIIGLDSLRTLSPGYPFVSNSTPFAITIDDLVNSGQAATVRLNAPTTNEYAPISYRGQVNYLLTNGTTLVVALLMCGGTLLGDDSYWRLVDTTHGVISTTLTATRHTAYLTPQ
jgi:hypothetical protein